MYYFVPKIIGLLFILLFVYAASSKLLAFQQFETQLVKSPFFSAYAHWMVWMIPLSELSVVVLFLFQKYLLLAFYSSLFIMTLFSLYIYLVLNFSDSIPCACGGFLSNLGWREHFIFNMVFIILALIGVITTHKQRLIPFSK
ncbi:MAG: hypothetical protein COW44_08355 [Flavobacteriaceae bacterium CG17_big_fil_post_rev_8_21_14_2_50_33_15]|nr:MAG: hypothetical protein COW44_08355 [Flavobacteriaceae bacterium CG17_big_fil_post_rev_8_21_14_2_50_33_15]PJB20165.1 MAG: hypothetical protein CO117_01970 [Flavobacteriaceae bacterium CG_4_9_14_3_um_filter_33_16]